jgi:hypothetical protein
MLRFGFYLGTVVAVVIGLACRTRFFRQAKAKREPWSVYRITISESRSNPYAFNDGSMQGYDSSTTICRYLFGICISRHTESYTHCANFRNAGKNEVGFKRT